MERSIGDAGAVAIAGALEANTRLWVLSLEQNSIGEKGALALARAITVGARNIFELGLSLNPIPEKGARKLMAVLDDRATALRRLALPRNGREGLHAPSWECVGGCPQGHQSAVLDPRFWSDDNPAALADAAARGRPRQRARVAELVRARHVAPRRDPVGPRPGRPERLPAAAVPGRAVSEWSRLQASARTFCILHLATVGHGSRAQRPGPRIADVSYMLPGESGGPDLGLRSSTPKGARTQTSSAPGPWRSRRFASNSG